MREADEAWKRAQLLGGQPTASASFPHCTPYKLPSLGVIQLSPDHIITLESDAIFTPSCAFADQGIRPEEEGGGITTIADFRDPFHASITPQAYATGAATVIAWMLVIMLIITPRTFFVGGSSGRSGLMGRRGMISGASGGGSIIGVGTRPWLQKVAALTVAVSLTLATADTFKIAERQYESGIMDATELRDQVVSGLEIRVSRVVSDVFLWLAQVQTLIRLFPRHKEKVIIKWVGFALILLDIIFSSLNSFGPYDTNRRPPHFATAIPALSYLFQLSLSMLYAAWVMYYAITKRRYAFYHSMMWNIAIVALLSVIAILTPVVFFITDIANYSIAGWGDYFRWVGAAAASVIVWEWVERIEALEREERKDGILGREIYDGDDMLDTTPSHEVTWPQSKRQSYMNDNDSKPGNGGSGGASAFASGHMARFTNLAQRLGRTMTESPRAEARKKRTIHIPAPPPAHRRSDSSHRPGVDGRTYHPLQNPPTVPVVSSPVSRTDTTSADSTVYTVRYHPISETPPIQQPVALGERLEGEHAQNNTQTQESQSQVVLEGDLEKGGIEVVDSTGTSRSHNRSKWHWQAVTQPFRRKGQAPPEEVQKGRVVEPLVMDDVTANIPPRNYSGLALKDRLGTFAAHQGERFRSKKNTTQQSESSLPVTIIPAQPRGKTWSPEILHQQQPQSEEVSDEVGISVAREPPRSVPVIPEDENEQIEAANRNSRIRFAPEMFHRHSGRQGVEEETRGPSRPLSSAVLGTEVHEQVPWTGSTQMVQDQPSGVDPSIVEQPTHTNHDR